MHIPTVSQMIPSTGFVPRYMDYVTRLTDAPHIYHIASVLGALSAVLGKHTRGVHITQMDSGPPLLSAFPVNIWNLIVGPSGDRKTTAMQCASEVAQEVVGYISSIEGSPEAAFDEILHNPSVFWYHEEGATLFSQMRASYWIQGQGLLCQMYDGRDDPPYIRKVTGKRTKKNAKPKPIILEIRSPRITLLVGIATDLLESTTKKEDWGGGLIGRMLMVYGEIEPGKEDERPKRTDDVGRKRMTNFLSAIEQTYAGSNIQMVVTDDAMAIYYAWVRHLFLTTANRPAKLKPLFRRLPVHILRVAALFAASMQYDVISVDAMTPALYLGDYSRYSIDRVGDLLADDLVMRNVVRIRDILRRSPNGMVPLSELSESLRMSWSTMDPALKTLTNTGVAYMVPNPDNPSEKILKMCR